MKTGYLVSIGAIVAMAGVFLFSQEQESELDRVSRQVQALQTEVSSLANQVQLLRRDFANLRRKGAAIPPAIPPGVTGKEINGVKYYLVPVENDLEAKSP